MSVPSYDKIMYPLLKLIEDKQEHTVKELLPELSAYFALSEADLTLTLPSNKIPMFYHRAQWAKTYLSKAKLIDVTRRGYFRITDRGIKTLKEQKGYISKDYLMKFPEFAEFVSPSKKNDVQEIAEDDTSFTPSEQFQSAYKDLRNTLISDLQEQISKCTPSFFEQLVVDVLLGLGYGGSVEDAGRAIGRSGDEGIDGIIKEDILGLDEIYIQAKKWEGKVGRPEIQKFAGALLGKKAHKGVFITTSEFSAEAVRYAENLERKVVLIDGRKLAELMVKHNIGVSVKDTYEIKEIDTDYFNENML
ncbi:restriction endonuclease [Geovibrio thiophilus]|uniref:Restriction endonuclease n=1 Tax=Geovibrio thiophilus TaxID=139438 RepID=A0A410JX52_9BACT|nr:restriction endonuclease [Geovibrio thiophilus]QAR32744.1 restriction endonuclease [Geovibrio thiophilus]